LYKLPREDGFHNLVALCSAPRETPFTTNSSSNYFLKDFRPRRFLWVNSAETEHRRRPRQINSGGEDADSPVNPVILDPAFWHLHRWIADSS
jgi:hypothetical protein